MLHKKEASEKDATMQNNTSENRKPEGNNNSLSRRNFIGRTAIGGAAAAGLLALPSVFTKSGEIIAQISQDCTVCEIVPYDNGGSPSGKVRRDLALKKRTDAANFEIQLMPIPNHPCNCDEQTYSNRNYIGNFTKGLKRAFGPAGDKYGEVDPEVYKALLEAFDNGSPTAFENLKIKLGYIPDCGTAFSEAESRLSPEAFVANQQRRLENPQAGLNFDTEGKDYYQLNNNPGNNDAFPAAPAIASKEEFTEIVENYWQALTRDVAFVDYENHPLIQAASVDISKFADYYTGPLNSNNKVVPQLYSRGITPGDIKGPFLSQFFLRDIPYGRQTIDAKILSPKAEKSNDFMTNVPEWLEIQKGRTPSKMTSFIGKRYIRSGRDLAEFVRVDAIYQAYLNAALLLITDTQSGGLGAPLSEYNPYNRDSTVLTGYCKQNNFVEFGVSQLLTLLGEVAVRAHKAVWYQKWQVHRRLRPEAFGALVHFKKNGSRPDYPIDQSLINLTSVLNLTNNTFGSFLLPQAFPEGSPMHPAYGAGHATLAGACVTILKAWFDSEKSFYNYNTIGYPVNRILVPKADGLGVDDVTTSVMQNFGNITYADELNKLAANVSIARNIAGVHWRSDYTESIYLGEQVAIHLLEDYGYTYNEKFEGFTFRDFRGVLQTKIGRNR